MAHPGYSFQGLTPVGPADPSPHLEPRYLSDVRRAFDRIRSSGDYVAARAPDDSVFPQHRYTSVGQGDTRGFIHFQGIQRLRNGRFAIVSGGDALETASHLFVIEMSSRYARGPWGSNVVRSNEPPAGDDVVHVLAVDDVHWHGGGVAVLGDVVAIPLEAGIPLGVNDSPSRTVFLSFADPHEPKHIPVDIEGIAAKAGAVALTRLPNGHFLCGIWREQQVKKPKPPGFFDLYLSKSDDLTAGFPANPFTTIAYSDVLDRGDRRPSYQAVAFLPEMRDGDPATYRLYMAGTWNGSDASPTLPGPDLAHLHALELDPQLLAASPRPIAPRMRFLEERQFFCRDAFGNFDAGGGFHVDESGRLHLYSAFHWRYDEAILITEFRHDPEDDAPPVTQVQDGWIDLFEHDRFRGRRLSIIGTKDQNLPDYSKISVQGTGFGDRVSSARWQIPAGRTYRLYADANYREDGVILDLPGTGSVDSIPDFKRENFGDRVSSSRYRD